MVKYCATLEWAGKCMVTEDLKELKSQFLEYLEIEKGRGVKTVENYDRYLTRFLEYSLNICARALAFLSATIKVAHVGLASGHV